MTVITAQQSLRTQQKAAHGLAQRGLVAGDRVTVSVPPGEAVLGLVLGALRCGVVPVPLDPALTRFERDPMVADADPALDITSPEELDALLGNDGRADLADVPLARPMHYTSGTTGRPKGVWSGLLDERSARALLAEEVQMWGLDEGDRHLVTSPLHHSAPLRFATTTLLLGGEVVLPGRFDPTRWLSAAQATRPTTSFLVPTHLSRLLAAGLTEDHVRSLRLLAHAGAACPDGLKRRVLDVVPSDVLWEFYGSTEGQFTACSGREWLERPGTVGRARPGRRLRTEPGTDQIWCEMPPHARFSYWRDPAKTAGAWRGDSLTVGDLGRLDEAGYLYLQGRRADLVISGGVNVYPAEVESVLEQCPGVADVAVFGVPDEDWGQAVCAAVVGDAGEASLRDWAVQRLVPAKRPKRYVRVDELPRTASGKVLRRELAAAAQRRARQP